MSELNNENSFGSTCFNFPKSLKSKIIIIVEMKTDQKSDLQKYEMIKKDIQLPVKVKLYFLIFENALNNTNTACVTETKSSFSKELLTAFTSLSAAQKGMYMLHNLNFVLEQLDSLDKERTKPDSGIDADEIRNI